MWLGRGNTEKKEGGNPLVAVAIDKDKGSQSALKWAIDNILNRGQTVVLIHVKLKQSHSHSYPSISFSPSFINSSLTPVMRWPNLITIPRSCSFHFGVFATRKDIQCKDVILEDTDVVKALIEYVSHSAIEVLVVGAPAKGGFLRRFKAIDIPGSITKGAPDFCTVYVISKGKISSTRSASRAAPAISPLRNQIMNQGSIRPDPSDLPIPHAPSSRAVEKPPVEPPRSSHDDFEHIKSPFTRGARGPNGRSYGEISLPDSDISFVSSGRPSTDRMFPPFYDSNIDIIRSNPRLSNSSDMDNQTFESSQMGRKSMEIGSPPEFLAISQENDRTSWSSQSAEDVEAEMRRLKLELKQTMDMYSTACKEALSAKQKVHEIPFAFFSFIPVQEVLRRSFITGEGASALETRRRTELEEARLAEEAALAIAEREKAKSRAAIEHAEAAQRIAELEAQKRINAEMKAIKEAEEKKKVLDSLAQTDVRYRKYTIEEIESATEFFSESRKIGEGGYGPVYKCNLDHTQVAIKVLRPDAAQGRSQFQQEVEVLSCIRHPNMVLLLGACPEYGCLVYEYMANGSLEDRLFRRGDSPPLSWQLRFRIAAEIGTGLLFLHQTKPEPLVHRDLKPANILLDRKLPGTFCYIDPEYQQTGMLGIKSDVYSLGIMLLQIITAKPPMGLTHLVERAIEKDTFEEMLDPVVPDWPLEEALSFAKIALQCAELRRKDRPDLGKADVASDPLHGQRGYSEASSKSRSTSYFSGRSGNRL
ncbi:U-box domain-containing protein 35 [Vitis vinifera]|uniref:RING-type E3 ubiquitin transferase n=1 Tax=Vitis vinifera TaxID=29760 RepID=A0A438C255_VITVI|nr:U-box domain-containing protein 35 [Vitis vinifera]